MEDKENHNTEFDEPTEEDKELVRFIVDHTDRWRDYRDSNYMDAWNEYERIFRGQWDAADKTRESERSRIISPATQQAVETRHAEIMEAIFGQGDFFDIKDDILDVNKNPLDVESIKNQLKEDFAKDKVRKSMDQIELLAEIYGTGIGEIVVGKKKEYIPATMPIPGVTGPAAIGVQEKERISVQLKPVNPKNFLIDPNADSIEDALGCAIEKYVSIHKVVENIERGVYRKVDIGSTYDDTELEPTQDLTNFQDNKVKLLTYYGLVPREYIEEAGGEEYEELFPEGSEADEYCNLVEAIVVIANDNTLLSSAFNSVLSLDRKSVV